MDSVHDFSGECILNLRYVDADDELKHFSRPPIFEDIAPIRRYADCLRKVTLFSSELTDESLPNLRGSTTHKFTAIDANVYRELNTLIPIYTLLPNVRRITCHTWKLHNTSFWMFLGSNVRSLAISSYGNTPKLLREIISTISERCIDLRVLKWDELSHKEYVPMVSQLVSQYDGLRVLELPSLTLDPEGVERVAALAHLHTLTWGGDHQAKLHSEFPGLQFPRLRHYEQTNPVTLPSFMTTASHFTSTEIETLSLRCYNPNATQLYKTFVLLHDRINLDCLTFVRIAP